MTQPLTSVAQCRTMGSVIGPYERRAMNEHELVSLLKAHKWTYRPRSRRSTGKKYIYAVRWRTTGNEERYIAPVSRLEQLTEDFILSKLEDRPIVAATTECLMPGQPIHSVV